MKTENFDEAVRQKIESVNPQFDEREIDKVHEFVTKNRTASPAIRFGYIFGASVACLMIAGLLYWNLSQMNDHKQLIETISDLKKDIAQKEATPPLIKTDTVFVKEYVHDAPVKTNSYAKQISPNIENNIASRNENIVSNKAILEAPHQQENLSKKDESVANKIDESITSKGAGPPSIKKTNEVQEKKKDDQIINKPVIVSNETKEGDVSKENPNEITEPQETIFDTTKNVNKPKHKLFSFLKGWQYQMGLGMEIANNQYGYNVYGEVLFSDKFSFNAGAKILKIGNEDYGDDSEYNHKQETGFRDVYKNYIPDNTDVSNIKIQSQIVQIPLAITYHLYLKNYFSMLFSAGTDLEFNTKQSVSYKESQQGQDDENKSFDCYYPTSVFNNVVVSVGIEKRWKHFLLQVKPFVSPQITNVGYKKENLYYGLHLTTGYSFGG